MAETKVYTSGRYTFDYQAKFVEATNADVSRLETTPSAPSGYTTSNG